MHFIHVVKESDVYIEVEPLALMLVGVTLMISDFVVRLLD